MQGYGPHPRPKHDWPVPLSYHRPALRRARELGPQDIAQDSLCRTFSKWAFSEILHIKGRNFPDVFHPFTSTYAPYER